MARRDPPRSRPDVAAPLVFEDRVWLTMGQLTSVLGAPADHERTRSGVVGHALG